MAGAAGDDDDEVPDLVENFDEASKDEKATEDAKITEEAEGNDINWWQMIIKISLEIEDKDTSTKL